MSIFSSSHRFKIEMHAINELLPDLDCVLWE